MSRADRHIQNALDLAKTLVEGFIAATAATNAANDRPGEFTVWSELLPELQEQVLKALNVRRTHDPASDTAMRMLLQTKNRTTRAQMLAQGLVIAKKVDDKVASLELLQKHALADALTVALNAGALKLVRHLLDEFAHQTSDEMRKSFVFPTRFGKTPYEAFWKELGAHLTASMLEAQHEQLRAYCKVALETLHNGSSEYTFVNYYLEKLGEGIMTGGSLECLHTFVRLFSNVTYKQASEILSTFIYQACVVDRVDMFEYLIAEMSAVQPMAEWTPYLHVIGQKDSANVLEFLLASNRLTLGVAWLYATGYDAVECVRKLLPRTTLDRDMWEFIDDAVELALRKDKPVLLNDMKDFIANRLVALDPVSRTAFQQRFNPIMMGLRQYVSNDTLQWLYDNLSSHISEAELFEAVATTQRNGIEFLVQHGGKMNTKHFLDALEVSRFSDVDRASIEQWMLENNGFEHLSV
jgi:hypothetical protein